MVRRIAFVGSIALIAALAAPMRPALACSCAQPSVSDLIEANPDVALAVIRRIDRDGGAWGVGLVEQTLRGSLPEQVPLHLDDGASCRPWVGTGQLAALAFERDGASWRTIDCGMVDPAEAFEMAYGAFRSDPDARGQPAVMLAGPMPGAGLVLLDEALKILSVSPEPVAASWLEACGDALLTVEERPGGAVARLRSIPQLDVIAERALGTEMLPQHLLDAECAHDGRVAAITRAATADGGESGPAFHSDLFAEHEVALPPAEDAAIVGDEALLLHTDHDARASVLVAHNVVTGDVEHRAKLAGVDAYELYVAPGGHHIAIRGFADEPVLIVVEAATGAVVARAGGRWMPTPAPWLSDSRLLLADEGRGLGDADGAGHRIVDLQLNEVDIAGKPRALTASSLIASDGLLIAVGGSELTIAAPDGTMRVSGDPRTSTAWNAALVGPVTLSASAPPAAAIPEPDPVVAAQSARDASNPTLAIAIAGLGVVAALGAAVWRIRHVRAQNPLR